VLICSILVKVLQGIGTTQTENKLNEFKASFVDLRSKFVQGVNMDQWRKLDKVERLSKISWFSLISF